jgi:hypothetical protein
MTVYRKAGLFLGYLTGKQCAWNINVNQPAADRAMHVVMTVSTTVEAACLVAEWELKYCPMLGEQVQRAVHRPVGNSRVLLAHTLENLSGCHMPASVAYLAQDCETLRCHANSIG